MVGAWFSSFYPDSVEILPRRQEIQASELSKIPEQNVIEFHSRNGPWKQFNPALYFTDEEIGAREVKAQLETGLLMSRCGLLLKNVILTICS